MFRKCIALTLCLMMAFSSVSATTAVEDTAVEDTAAEDTAAADTAVEAAAEETALFPKVNTFTGFSDTGTHWALSYIKLCYETGLMQGQGGGRFAPDARITNAEIAMLTARIHAAIHGTGFESGTTPWYKGAIDHLTALNIKVGSPNANATRQGFFDLLNAVLPDSMLLPINSITMLPDTSDPAVLKFYNAGILTGVDHFGTFNGAAPLTRGECAAMVARVIDPTLRRYFTPAGQVPAAPFPDNAAVLTVNGTPVTFADYFDKLLSLIKETQALYIEYGLVFDWDENYGVDTWSWADFFKAATCHSMSAEIIATARAAELNCSPEDLALTLFGAPTQAELDAYAAEHDIAVTTPNANELLIDLVLEEKLNAQLGQWVKEADLATTEIYDELDVKDLWETFG